MGLSRSLPFILLFFCGAAFPCGYCVEDKIASVYDHAAVTHALSQKHHVAYFHVEGALPAGAEGGKLLRKAAAAAPVDPAAVRVSAETFTLAVSFDPRRASLVQVQSAMEKVLAPKGLTLMPLRIMEQPADLKTVRR